MLAQQPVNLGMQRKLRKVEEKGAKTPAGIFIFILVQLLLSQNRILFWYLHANVSLHLNWVKTAVHLNVPRDWGHDDLAAGT